MLEGLVEAQDELCASRIRIAKRQAAVGPEQGLVRFKVSID